MTPPSGDTPRNKLTSTTAIRLRGLVLLGCVAKWPSGPRFLWPFRS
jgi:hypothetical protein